MARSPGPWRVWILAAGGLTAVGVLGPVAYEEYVGDSLTGGYTGAEKRAIARACTGGTDTTTLSFAKLAGRVNSKPTPEPEACNIDVLIDKSVAPDPMDAVDAGVRRAGWGRVGKATWKRADGFTVTVREWDPSVSDDPKFVEYDLLVGGSPGD